MATAIAGEAADDPQVAADLAEWTARYPDFPLLVELAGLRLRLAAKDEAIHELCHDLKSGVHVIQALAELIGRYCEREDCDRASAKAAELVRTVRARVERINAGEAAAVAI